MIIEVILNNDGKSTINQFPSALFTTYALVSEAKIINTEIINNHIANFFGCIDFTLVFPTNGISADLSISILCQLNKLSVQWADK